MNARGTGQKNQDRRRIDALLDKLYAMAVRGNVAAAGLYLDRVLGPVGDGRQHDDGRADLAGGQLTRSSAQDPDAEPSRPKRLLSVAEVAEDLGISKSMVDIMMRTGRLAPCRIGRRVLVRADDLRRLVDGSV